MSVLLWLGGGAAPAATVKRLAGDVHRDSSGVSEALKAAIRLQPRLFDLKSYGGDIERIIARAS